MQRRITGDIWVGGGVTCLGLILLVIIIPYGVDVPAYAEMAALAPNFWPQLISCFITVAGIGLLVTGLRTKETLTAGEDKEDDSYPLGVQLLRFVFAFGLLFMVYFCIDYLGMVVTTFIATLSFLLLGNVRKVSMLVGISVLLPCILYVFFVYVANVPLPIGNLFYAFM